MTATIARKSINLRAWKPALSTILAILIIAGAVAFAMLQTGRNTVTGNTVETVTANLQLSRGDGVYSNSVAGHDYAGVIPGGVPMPTGGFPVYFKNVGNTALALRMSVSSVPTSTGGVDFSKVHILITPITSGSNIAQSFTLQALMDADATGGLAITTGSNLAAGGINEYNIQVSMDSDAVSSTSATLGNLDLSFIGTAVTT